MKGLRMATPSALNEDVLNLSVLQPRQVLDQKDRGWAQKALKHLGPSVATGC